jgi:hypothetical protein
MYPVDEPPPSHTNIVDIYLPNDDLRVVSNFEASSSNSNDQHDGQHTMGPPSPQLWHDGRFEHIPLPPPSSYHYDRFDSLRDAAADGSSTTTSTSFLPQHSLPHSSSAMSLNAQSHPQVVHHFQPESAVGTMYPGSMHQHHAVAGTLHSVGAISDVSESSLNVVRELSLDMNMH